MTKRKAAPRGKSQKAMPIKGLPGTAAIAVTGRDVAHIRAGTSFAGIKFKKETPIEKPVGGYIGGIDYAVHIVKGRPIAKVFDGRMTPKIIGGFHFAPGGNAAGVKGGDTMPAINPLSAWDRGFRPTCKDPRGMTLVNGPRGKLWCDIYLLGRQHLDNGTSRFMTPIADGSEPPQNPAGGFFAKCDFAAVVAVYKHHGKQLLGAEEFFAAAYGGTERSSASEDPKVTRLDAVRTSQCGVMQPFGNMLTWGTDGHPDDPRPSIFGGSWLTGSNAGSRYAFLVYWPEYSDDDLGARGRSDHLQLA
jgi:hypothetical protein